MKNIEPCKVCGSTEANLVDGYYYCIECGTQDVNVRETVVEEMQLADGTISYKHKKKIYKAAEEDDNLSGEWHKWHAFNFILVGLADEIIAIGAKPTFKKKLLWLWTEYMKKYQNKKELGLTTEGDENQQHSDRDITDNEGEDAEDGFYDEELFKCKKRPPRHKKQLKMNKDVHVGLVKRQLFVGLIYIALNLDGCDYHLSDLFWFIKQGKFDIQNCEKYVPKEIKIKEIPQWEKFTRSRASIREMEIYIMSLYKFFKIVPLIPDLKVLVHRYAKELCLPDDFKNLVFSLMHLVPCDYLKFDVKAMNSLLRLPLYECIVMSYFLVAFKMLFGLDDDYNLRLSDAVDKANDENCFLKSYNLGSDSEPTDRLFSFREWCNFIQLRKIILCKNYLHMAEHYQLPVDHYVYMEQDHQRKTLRKPTLTDEITMTLLGRIPQVDAVAVIPISEFTPTVTPLTSASEVVLQYFNDPDLKLLFSEDFTQYSLKYATEKLYLNINEENPRNIIVGVSTTNKIINKKIIGTLDSQKVDLELVYVRNCDNKNWLKTNQPSKDHVKVETKSDKESDHGYDSNAENASTIEISSTDAASATGNAETRIQEEKIDITKCDSDAENASAEEMSNSDVINVNDSIAAPIKEENSKTIECDSNSGDFSTVEISSSDDTNATKTETPIQEEMKEELEEIEEEALDKNIFDDDFADLDDRTKSEPEADPEHVDDNHQNSQAGDDFHDAHPAFPSTSANQDDSQSDISLDDSERFFNPSTFDREKTIRELVLAKCKKYKIRVPEEYSTKEPKKRKSKFIDDGAGGGSAKKHKPNDGTIKKRVTQRGKVKEEINNLLAAYYENLKHDVLLQISEHVKSVINNVSRTHEETSNTERIQEATITNSINDNCDLNIEDNTDHENVENNDINSSNLEQSSVQIIDGELDDTQPKDDPRFDENEYDPKQLYVRVDEVTEIEDVYNVADDPDIAAILDKKIEEIDKGEVPTVVTSQQKKKVDYDSDDDDIPISILKAEKESILLKNKQNDNLPPLLNRAHVNEFNYWSRQYESEKLRKAHDLHDEFYVELDKNFPKSFIFVIKECADVIGYTPFRLYRVLMGLERKLLSYKNLNS